MEDGERDWNDKGRKVKENEKEDVEIEGKIRRSKKERENIKGQVKTKKEKKGRLKEKETYLKNRYMEMCK